MAYGKRPAVKKRPPQPVQSSGLDTRMNEAAAAGGGIRPGAHPEYENIKPGLANPIDVIRGLFRKKKKAPK